MTAVDLTARADRVKQIATSLYGRVLDREGDTMRAEIPADLIGAAGSAFHRAAPSSSDSRPRAWPRAGSWT
jgi:hypothetical protein